MFGQYYQTTLKDLEMICIDDIGLILIQYVMNSHKIYNKKI